MPGKGCDIFQSIGKRGACLNSKPLIQNKLVMLPFGIKFFNSFLFYIWVGKVSSPKE